MTPRPAPDPEPGPGPGWTALYTRSRHEKKVEFQLRERRIECYLPLRRVLKRWSDRRTWVEEPLFRSYLFIRGNPEERYRAVQCAGVVRPVTFLGRLALVRDEEIGMIRRILADAADPEACPPSLAVGDWVEIETGPLAGLRGRLEHVAGDRRLIVSVPSIQQGIRFNVEGWNVRKTAGP
jgi:transcription antitermination factor NusG